MDAYKIFSKWTCGIKEKNRNKINERGSMHQTRNNSMP